MLRSPEDGDAAHPYWYARVLGVYHAEVSTSHAHAPASSRTSQPMQFLFVRWFGVEPRYRSGSRLCKLPKVGFVDESEGSYAFGFVDPALVIRCCHMIPDFSSGRTDMLLRTTGPSKARAAGEVDDWTNYYVNIFADRDMFMRYFGGGVGHSIRLQPDGAHSTIPGEQDGQQAGDDGDSGEADVSSDVAVDLAMDMDDGEPDDSDSDMDYDTQEGHIDFDDDDERDEEVNDDDEDEDAEGRAEEVEVVEEFEDTGYASM
ncbi:hypothetical protein EV121DRAFT_207017 [Schizophyllum commune]